MRRRRSCGIALACDVAALPGGRPGVTLDCMDGRALPRIDDLKARIDAFVRDVCIPEEGAWRASGRAITDELRRRLNDAAREAGLFAPHVSRDYGGLALDHRERAVAFRAAGYSMLGPLAIHCAAPDEGNQHLLGMVADAAQREAFLRPLCEGARSCFMMTEPDGAGSDPTMLATTARRDGADYVIDGVKWYITGAIGATFAIIMARDESQPDAAPTMFLTPMDAPGIEIVRELDVMAHDSPGGHCVVRLSGLRVPARNVLGEAGQGFRYAQLRLSPARLTHCMRWLGAAERCHDIARHHAARRHGGGRPLAAHQGVGFLLADNAIDIHTSSLAIDDACARLDRGEKARHESSMVKVFVSEAVSRIVDRSAQVLGGLGMTADTPVEHIYRSVRAFRIYDGASEVHRAAIARRITPDSQAMPSIVRAEGPAF